MTGSTQDWSNFSMLELFRMEVESQVAILVENLLALERCAVSESCDLPETEKMLESLMRAAHSIKGAARIVQIDAAVEIAHRLEDCFVAAQKGSLHLDADRVDVLLKGVDLLAQIGRLEEEELNDWCVDRQKLIEGQTRAIAAIITAPSEVTTASTSSPELDAEIDAEIESEPLAAPDPPPVDEEILEEVLIDTSTAPTDLESEPEIATSTTQPNQELKSESTGEPKSEPKGKLKTEAIATKPTSTAIDPKSPDSKLTDPKQAAQDRVVRISIDNLNQLMALAGESLVEVNWLQPFADSLFQLKRRQQELSRLLENFQSLLPDTEVNANAGRYLAEAQQKSRDCHELLSDRLNDLELFSRRFTNLSDSLYHEVIASHMRPLC
jgi:two-component system sensor histidine kinase and response regulator WspE